MALPKLVEIANPKRCPLPEAMEAARTMAQTDATFDISLAQALNLEWAAHQVDLPVVERMLHLLAEVAPPPRLFLVLRSALRHSDPHVRSKAALILGRNVESPEVLLQLVTDGDARVRANTVQALWGRKDPAAFSVLEKGLDDLHHRVAANAAYGLILVDPEGQVARLNRFIRHPHPRFRRAGAWILRKIGDPANLKELQSLVTDKNAEVRTSAFKSLIALRQIEAKQGIVVEEASDGLPAA